MAPRTGKTKVAVDYACIMHEAGHVNRVLITCPVAVMSVWEDEIAANVPDRIKYSVTVWDKEARKDTALPKWGKNRLDFVIINHDAFSTAGKIVKRTKDEDGKTIEIKRSRKRGGRYEMKRSFLLWQPQLICVDESHRYKSPSSAKFRTLLSLVWTKSNEARIPYRVIMTGTPVTKKKRIFDIYAQWRILNPRRFRGMTFTDFKHHYARWVSKGSWEMWVANRPREVEELRAQIHKDSFAVTREECFDLPAMVPQVIHFDLTGESAEAYDQMAEEMVAELKSGDVIEAKIALVMTMRLEQISSGVARTSPTPEHEDGQLVRIGWDKLNVLESIISDLFEADEKVVIAGRFSSDISGAAEICQRLKVPYFTLQGRRKGPGQDRKTRARDLKRFKNMDGPACYIVQPASGSMGIDLSAASTLIWVSLTPSWVDYTQMNDRIALNPHSVSIIYLIASPSNHLLYNTLLEDGDLAKAVTDSPERLLRNYKNPAT
jgi:SNF2 family DNA or RNA helicase